MLDTPCSEVVWRVLPTHSIRQFPLHFPSRVSPCAITFQLDSNMATCCQTERHGMQILPHATFRQAPGPSLSYSTGYGRKGRGGEDWVGRDLTAHLNVVSLVTSSLYTNLDNSLTELKAQSPWKTGKNGVHSVLYVLRRSLIKQCTVNTSCEGHVCPPACVSYKTWRIDIKVS